MSSINHRDYERFQTQCLQPSYVFELQRALVKILPVCIFSFLFIMFYYVSQMHRVHYIQRPLTSSMLYFHYLHVLLIRAFHISIKPAAAPPNHHNVVLITITPLQLHNIPKQGHLDQLQ